MKLSIEDLKEGYKKYRNSYFNLYHNKKRDGKRNKRYLDQIRFQLEENQQLKNELDEANRLIELYITQDSLCDPVDNQIRHKKA